MAQRGGGTIQKNHNAVTTIMIEIRAPTVFISMDIRASSLVQLDELKSVCATWMKEKTKGRYLAHPETILLRQRTKTTMHGTMTLQEAGIETNEIFYLI